jgi:putative flippase GtrA
MMPEFARFAVVGAIGLLVTGGVFNLMLSRHQAAFAANAAATVAAAVVTFVGSRYWTFRHRERTGLGRETTAFIALNLIGILIQQACLELARHELGAGQNGVTLTAALLLGVGLATLFRFWSYRRFIWLRLDISLAVAKMGRPAVPPAMRPPGPGLSRAAIWSRALTGAGPCRGVWWAWWRFGPGDAPVAEVKSEPIPAPVKVPGS